jgi:hypothetical protein
MKKTITFLITTTLSAIGVNAQMVSTFNYTGAMQTYVVPPGVTSIDVAVRGAEGGDAVGTTVGWGGGPVNVDGGDGGEVTATLSVTPGETLYLFVGGEGSMSAGGFNGGGNTAVCSGTEVISAGGGGASDIRQGGMTLADRVIVAGGGGGAGGSGSAGYCTASGSGAGGGTSGANSSVTSGSGTCLPGFGGTQVSGGNGGNNTCWCSLGDVGGVGTLGIGGSSSCVASGLSVCSCSGTGCVGGGGGGGGYYGGGAGLAFGGGGGGSSYAGPGATSVVHTQGSNTGDGQIVITVLCTGLTTSVSATSLCATDLLTLSAVSTTGGTVTWDLGVTDNVPFQPDTNGVVTYTATSDSPSDCAFSVDITVLEAPVFALSTSDEFGGSDGGVYVTLIDGLFPFTYDWDNDGTGDFDDPQNLTNVPAGNYTVEVMQGNGCSDIQSATVNSQLGLEAYIPGLFIYPNPAVEFVTIELPGEFQYRILDLSGRELVAGNGVNKKSVSLGYFARGSYVLIIETDKYSVSRLITAG